MKKLTTPLALFLSLILILSTVAEGIPAVAATDAASTSLSNPTIDSNGVTTWDCVYFGNYLKEGGDSKEPIKWRVLSVDGSDAFLMSDDVLDEQQYAETEEEDTSCTWETSALRTWLNQDFYQNAFSQEEQAAILTTNVVNENNADTGTDGGNNTEDKIYVLSVNEVCKAEYGFDTDPDKESKTRLVGKYGEDWWLRTPCEEDYQAIVNWTGSVSRKKEQYAPNNYLIRSVRPVLHLDLDKTSVWTETDSVKSEETSTPTSTPTTKPSMTPTSTPTTKPSTMPTSTPTTKPNTTTKPTTTTKPGTSQKPNTSSTPKVTPVPKKPAPNTKMKPGEKKAISSFKDLQAMENIPSGSYYLKKDITVPKNARIFCDYPFTGTLDGRGHKIKGYQVTNTIVSGPLKKDNIFNELENSAWQKSDSHVGIFDQASKATFKNISVTNVKINVKTDCCAYVGALVTSADSCTFSNVHVSGKITVNSTRENPTGWGFLIGGIASSGSGKMVNCSNSAAITANCRNCYDGNDTCVGGLAGYFSTASLLKNCSNSGNISLSGYGCEGVGYDRHFSAAGLMITYNQNKLNIKSKMISCTNSGNITVKAYAKKKEYDTPAYNVGDHFPICCGQVNAVGLVGWVSSATSCGNTGKIKVSNQFEDSGNYVAGVAGKLNTLASRCYNKGAISFTGATSSDREKTKIGGVFGDVSFVDLNKNQVMSECYNTGKVSAKITNKTKHGSGIIGGVAGACGGTYCKLTNCYNAGTVSVSGNTATIGGVCGAFVTYAKYARYNYNAGTVKVPRKEAHTGAIFGDAEDTERLDNRRHTYDNYYKGSVAPYGIHASWKDWKPLAKKVSSITSAKCPKLSSKYWVYSSKVKRLVLKKNNETKSVKKTKKKSKKKSKK